MMKKEILLDKTSFLSDKDKDCCIDFDKVKPEHKRFAENYKCPLCYNLVYKPVTCTNCLRILGNKCLSEWTSRAKTCPICNIDNFTPMKKTSPIIITTLDEFELSCWNKKCKLTLNHDNYYTHSCLEREEKKAEMVNIEGSKDQEEKIKGSNSSVSQLNKMFKHFSSDKGLSMVNISKKDSGGEYLNLSMNCIKEAKYDSAIVFFEKALAKDPTNYKIPYKIGNLLLEAQALTWAIKVYQKALEIDPQQKKIYFNIGNALSDIGKYEEAIDNYTIAVTLDPQYNQAYNNLGLSYLSIGKDKAAEDNFKQAIRINPQHKQAYNNLAVSQLNQKKFDEAAESCLKALEIDPNYKQSIENLEIIMKKQDKYSKKQKDKK